MNPRTRFTGYFEILTRWILPLLAFSSVVSLSALAADVDLPFTLCHGRAVILVQAEVNGRTRTFMLDTGANHSVVSPEAAGISTAELHTASLTSGGAGYHGEAMWRTVSLALGDRKWKDRPTVVMDLTEASRAFGQKIDGLIGEDLLADFSEVTIDFKMQRLRLSR